MYKTKYRETGEINQEVKALAPKPYLSLVPRTHVEEDKSWLLQVIYCLCTCALVMHPLLGGWVGECMIRLGGV